MNKNNQEVIYKQKEFKFNHKLLIVINNYKLSINLIKNNYLNIVKLINNYNYK
jgi:hypothetical protein